MGNGYGQGTGAAARGDVGLLPFVVATAALFILGAYFRVNHLFDVIRLDEATTYVLFVTRPLGEAISAYELPNNHILNTILAKLAVVAFGPEPWSLRLPNLLAGLGVMALTAIISRRWFGRAASVAALAVVAVSPLVIHYSVLTRGYGLMLFFGLLTLLSVERRHAGGAGKYWPAATAVSAALAFYAVPTAVLFVAPLAAYDLTLSRKEGKGGVYRWAALWLGAAGLTALLYSPVVWRNGWRTLLVNEYTARLGLADMGQYIRLYGRELADEKTWGVGGLPLWGALFSAGIIAGLVRRKAYGVFCGLCAGTIAVFFIAAFQMRPRVFCYLWLLGALGVGALAAAAVSKFRFRWKGAAWVGVAAVVLAAAAAGVAQERKSLIDDSCRSGAAPEAREIAAELCALPPLSRLAVNGWYDDTLRYYFITSGATTEAIDHCPPSAFTFEAYVVVQPGSTVREEVDMFFWDRRVYVCRQELVRRVGDAGLWRVVLVNPE
ncbi:MAG: glycosyltransferase family 39 protein [bacterium]